MPSEMNFHQEARDILVSLDRTTILNPILANQKPNSKPTYNFLSPKFSVSRKSYLTYGLKCKLAWLSPLELESGVARCVGQTGGVAAAHRNLGIRNRLNCQL